MSKIQKHSKNIQSMTYQKQKSVVWNNLDHMLQNLIISFAFFVLVIIGGTFGYYFVAEEEYSLLDCLYMTVITVTTIGYGEVIDFSNNSLGKTYTIILAFSGIGVLTYFFSNLSAYIIEGNLKINLAIRKMRKEIKKLNNHYLICGAGRVGFQIAQELHQSRHTFVLIDEQDLSGTIQEEIGFYHYIQGDATEDAILLDAGIAEASGIFIATGSDNQNLVITLTARLLNPEISIITRCDEKSNFTKMKRAGADSVIAPTNIGGVRMTREMLKPYLTSFVDRLFSGREEDYGIDTITVGENFSGKRVSEIDFRHFPSSILIALHLNLDSLPSEKEILFNPSRSSILHQGDILIFLTSQGDKEKLKEILSF